MSVTISSGICFCGCGGRTKNATRTNVLRQTIKDRPVRYIYCHQLNKLKHKGPEYKVDRNGCWIWQKRIDCGGYGQQWNGAKLVLAHRFYYEKFKGKIPNGLVLDHLCRVRACVNPEHLEIVTIRENCRRGNQSKITMKTAEEIRFLYQDGFKNIYALAWAFSLSTSNVESIINGKTWKR